jgi:cytochrome b
MSDTSSSFIRVWDAPVRVFHWLLALSFAGAWLTAESERWHLLHITLGYTAGGLVLFRGVWGGVGSRWARFTSFVRGPSAVRDYVSRLLRAQPAHFTGHNPAGGWAVLALLGGMAVTVGFGWATEFELLPSGLDDVHEAAASAVLGLVGIHLAGVLVGSWAHRENLVRAMFTGRKRGQPDEDIGSSRPVMAALLLALVLAGWAWQWHSAPAGSLTMGLSHRMSDQGDDNDDDD